MIQGREGGREGGRGVGLRGGARLRGGKVTGILTFAAVETMWGRERGWAKGRGKTIGLV